MITRKSFSFQLMKNFLISTLGPFLLITTVIARIFTAEYSRDIRLLLNSTISSMTSKITTYLNEAQQVTMQPYYNDTLYDYLMGLSKGSSYDIFNKIQLDNSLNSNMSFVRYTREDVNGIFICNEHQCLYYTVMGTDRKTLDSSYDYSAQSWYQEALRADGRCILIGPHTPDYISPYNQVISLVRMIVDIPTREPLYVIKIDINTSIFNRIFKDFAFHVDSKIILRDENRQIIYSNCPLEASDTQKLSGDLKDKGRISLEDGIFQTYTYPVDGYPWTISILLSDTQLKRKTSLIYVTAVLLYILGAVMAAVSYMMSSKKMVTAISHMKRILSSIENEDFSQNYEYRSDTELDDLGDSLNHMAAQLEKRIQTEYVMAIRQKDIEFRALQSQINPHFLFNTLNNFIALNQIGDRDTLENALYELSGMLRYVLKAPALIPLSQELSFIENYCALQKLRFSERLTYEVITDAGLGDVMIPKLLIQPVVENSILHGIEPCSRECFIRISVNQAEEGIRILVEDNGCGCETDRIPETGIGLANVRARLMTCRPKSRFHMESEPGRGTRTEIYLYLEEEER